MPIPMLDLKREYEYMKPDIDAAIQKCLAHQNWILGPEVKELEQKLSEYLGSGNCIGVSSGTEALVLSLRALAIKTTGKEFFEKTDRIITTSFTFTATGDAILRSGATPVFVDIDPASFNMSTERIRKYLSGSTGAIGIIPVHLYGQACNLDEIMQIAREHNLFVVEDVAQAFGGTWEGKKLGTLGNAGAFSFFPSKNLGGFGDGGMISTNDTELAELVRMLLKHGGKDKYNVDHVGYNARLDTIQAAILLAKLKYLDEFNRRRIAIAAEYSKNLSGLSGITVPVSRPPAGHVYHQYTIRVADGKRESIQKQLKGKDIASMIYYSAPLHLMKVFDNRCIITESLSETEAACKEVLSIPIEPLLTADEIKLITDAVSEQENK